MLIVLEGVKKTGWRCEVRMEGGNVLTNVYQFDNETEEPSARGHALAEANVIISSRQRFGGDGGFSALHSYIDAYQSTPQFHSGPLTVINTRDDRTLYVALARSVKTPDTVAGMICRGILDLGAEQREQLVRRLNG